MTTTPTPSVHPASMSTRAMLDHAAEVGARMEDRAEWVMLTESLASTERAAERALREAVTYCRERGLSWAEIAELVGTSKSATYQRFGA